MPQGNEKDQSYFWKSQPVVQTVQKIRKGLAAVYNKPEPPTTRNIFVPRKVKAERSGTTEVDCDSLNTHAA